MTDNNNRFSINDIRNILTDAIRTANQLDDQLGDTLESYRQQLGGLYAAASYVLDLIEYSDKKPEETPVTYPVSISYLLLTQGLRRYTVTDSEDNTTRICWAASVENIKRYIETERTDLVGNAISLAGVDQWSDTDIVVPNTPSTRDTVVLIPLSELDVYLASFTL